VHLLGGIFTILQKRGVFYIFWNFRRGKIGFLVGRFFLFLDILFGLLLVQTDGG